MEVGPAGGSLLVRWSPGPAERAAWSAPRPKGLPPPDPLVSLKLALPSPEAGLALEVESEAWEPAPPGVEAPAGTAAPTLSLGTRGVWRGIAYQELLVRTARRAGPGRGNELLAALAFRITLTGSRARFAAAGDPATAGGEAGLFLNPADVHFLEPPPPGPAAPAAAPTPSALTTPLMRLSVTQDGLYRADYAWLTARGFDPSAADARNLHVTCRGVELPVVVEGEADGVFGPGDAVVFYGQKLSITNRPVWNGGDFSDTSVYWLFGDAVPGLRMTSVPAAPVSGYPTVSSFSCVVHAETNNFLDAVDHLRPNGDLWYWGPVLGVAAGGAPVTRHYTLTTPSPAGGAATLKAVVAGLGPGAHAVAPQVNGASPSAGANPWTWSGTALTTATWTFSGGVTDGPTDVSLTLPGYADHGDYQIPDFFEATYARTLAAASDALTLTPPNANARYSSSGYSALPTALDLSRRDAATGLYLPRLLTGVSFALGTATFQMALDPGVTDRTVHLSAAPLSPAAAAVSQKTDLSAAANAADLLVVTHSDFVSASGTSAWQRWLARRQGRYTVKVVDIQDVFDNFSYGLFDPTALRTLLQTAGSAWSVKPRYVLLFGDGTWDYKDYLATAGFKNYVPSMMFEDLNDSMYLGRYASDAWFGDWNGDGYPDTAVGRLPVRSFAESEGVLGKLLAYEDQVLSGTWFKTALYVSDRADAQGQEFETYPDSLAATWTVSPWAVQKVYYAKPPYNGTDAAGCASAIRAAFPGAALASYSGHGSFTWWGYNGGASSIFTTAKVRSGNTASDVDLLAPSWQEPFVLHGTCYSSAFAEPGSPALAEDLLDRSDRGAIGSCGPTSIGYANEEQSFTSAFFQQAFGSAKWRVPGDLAEAGRFALPSFSSRAVFGSVLLGDPSMVLLLPAPAAPPSATATGLNASVRVDWTAPAPAPAGYNVYRSADGGLSWTRANAALIPAGTLTLTDPGLVNTRTYRYYVTSVDAGGFEGPPSPTVSATPLNPNPPAVPTGLSAVDAGTGDALQVNWTASPETDLDHYTLSWGTAPGNYTSSLAVPAGTTGKLLTGLTTGVTYYLTLSASNTSGRTSAMCPEVSAVPTGLRLAVRPPAMITDLKVTRSGADLVLSWSKPLLDVGGAPVTVTGFQIYRVCNAYRWDLDTVSLAPPNARVTLAATAAVSYTWTDTGAVSLAGTVTYLVVALNAAGDRSPASNPSPASVLGLRLEKSASTGHTLFRFNPVTTTLDGRPGALVDHYQLYGFYPVTAPSDHVRPGAPSLSVQLLASLPACESGAVYCDAATAPPMAYTVVAVDARGNTSLY